MPKHTCALCGQISFNYYYEYEAHRYMVHGMKTKIKPERVTGRTPKQIVTDAENTWLKEHLIKLDYLAIVATNREHLDACRCNNCFQKKLDLLVDSSEKSLDSLNNSVRLD